MVPKDVVVFWLKKQLTTMLLILDGCYSEVAISNIVSNASSMGRHRIINFTTAQNVFINGTLSSENYR